MRDGFSMTTMTTNKGNSELRQSTFNSWSACLERISKILDDCNSYAQLTNNDFYLDDGSLDVDAKIRTLLAWRDSLERLYTEIHSKLDVKSRGQVDEWFKKNGIIDSKKFKLVRQPTMWDSYVDLNSNFYGGYRSKVCKLERFLRCRADELGLLIPDKEQKENSYSYA